MPYEYKNPMLAGFYGHQQAQAELGATEAEIAGRAALARYQDSQVEDARLQRLLDMQEAPYKQRETYRKDIKGEADIEQAQRDYLVQNVGPLLARVKRGEMPEMEFRAHAQNVVGQAASLFGADEEDVREMLSWSPKEWGLAYEQSMAYKDQVKAPPAVQDIISGDRKQQKQWNPETRRMEVVGEGPRFAPQKPQRPKYGVFTNPLTGKPMGTYEIGPDGYRSNMLPTDEGEEVIPALPDSETVGGGIDRMAAQLGPGKRIKEVLSKTVAPAIGMVTGKSGSDAERDFQREKARRFRAVSANLNKVSGARSNLALTLALEGMAETGLWEGGERAANQMKANVELLRSAFDDAIATYKNPNSPKKVATDAYEQATAISEALGILAIQPPGEQEKAGKPAQSSGNRKIVVDY